jgi:hypothetical protein
MVYYDEKRLEALSAFDLAALQRESIAYDAALAKRGRYLAAAALKPVETATTVRLDNAKPAVTDGPFAETREQLGGFVFIEAANLDEAIAVAAKIPALRLGCIEIRAAKELKPDVRSET